ncbi:ATP-binding protein [Micromonospora fluostatini]|uniref:ATP-binding protein n=1 Tax=Micromonospora sp. JCM 30529 TaxID=3421643 RepID=UPI003D16ACB3
MDSQPDLDPRKVRDLATLAFVQAKANVAFLGPPGVGKTHIAVSLAVAACRAGFTVYVATLDDMVRHLKAADAIGRRARKLHTYGKRSTCRVGRRRSASRRPGRIRHALRRTGGT